MNLFIQKAYAMAGCPPQAGGQPQPSPIVSLFPIFIVFFIFYFLVIKPQKKKQVEHQKLLDNLGKNDEIVTSGGMHGVIVNIKKDTVMIRVDEGTKIEFQKSARQKKRK